jgi:hypothetical protein
VIGGAAQADVVERVVDRGAARGGRWIAAPQRDRQAQVLPAAQGAVRAAVDRQQHDEVTDPVGLAHDVAPQDQRLAPRWAQPRGQEPQQGRLAGAVGAVQGDDTSRRDVEVEASQDRRSAVTVDDAAQSDGGVAVGHNRDHSQSGVHCSSRRLTWLKVPVTIMTPTTSRRAPAPRSIHGR